MTKTLSNTCNRITLKLYDIGQYQQEIKRIEEFFLVHNITSNYFIILGITEAVNNAFFHSKGIEYIKLKIAFTGHRRVFIRITDNGEGFNGNEYLKYINSTDKDLFEERMLNEGGRGILIINDVFGKKVYGEKGNDLLLVKKFG